MLLPDTPMRRHFDFWLAGIICVSVVLMPFILGFEGAEGIRSIGGFLWTACGTYALDTLFGFVTTHVDVAAGFSIGPPLAPHGCLRASDALRNP